MSASLNIDCVDSTSTDDAIRYTRTMLPDALRVHSVGHMVRSILGKLRSDKIRRLRIFGHGTSGRQGLGRSSQLAIISVDYLSIAMEDNRLANRDVLAQLHGRFAPGGWAELHGCNVGQGPDGFRLLQALAQIWQVNVAAGIGRQSTTPGWEGNYLVAHSYTSLMDMRTGANPPREALGF